MSYALGKNAPEFDERTLKLTNYVNLSVLPTPPADSGARYKAVPSWGLWGNDRIGDCGVVGQGNASRFWTARHGGAPVDYTDAEIIRSYSAISGYDPATGKNDNGVSLLAALRHWHKTGNVDAAGKRHKVGAFVAVNLKNEELAHAACYYFDGLYIGLNLPITAQAQVEHGEPWDVVPSAGSQAYPGSWGGHCVFVPDYAADWPCATWAQIQQMTPAFWNYYCDEAYAIVSTDYLEGRRSVEGFTGEKLAHDLSAVSR